MIGPQHVVVAILMIIFLVVMAFAFRPQKCRCGCRKTTTCNWEVWGNFAWSKCQFDVVCANCGRFKSHVFGADYNRDDVALMRKKYSGPFKKE